MQIKRGIAVSDGLVIAEAFVLESEEVRIPRRFRGRRSDPQADIARFEAARAQSIAEIEALKQGIPDDVHREHAAMIFDAHQMMLKDPTLAADVQQRVVEEQHTAEYAVTRTFRHYKKLLRDLEGGTFAQRAPDFADIERRLLKNLVGEAGESVSTLGEPVVVVARDLSPSLTAALDRDHVVGIATDAGGPTSHTAILAGALSIPCVVGLANITDDVAGGDILILDGTRGLIILNPDEATLVRARKRQQAMSEDRDRLIAETHNLSVELADGSPVCLEANIEFIDEIPLALSYGAQGVGLFRSEFIFATAGGQPTEDEHYSAYRKALEHLNVDAPAQPSPGSASSHGSPRAPRPEAGPGPPLRELVIRTMDFGGEKFSRELGLAIEPNPALGLRSIRLSLSQSDLFRTQLRAVLRAAALGPVKLLFPMVTTLQELRAAKQIVVDVADELRAEGVPHRRAVPIGMMIEVPGAAIIADRFAREVDFFSVGTNDLIQYTLAADRVNAAVADLYQPDHPAVIDLLARVQRAADAAGIPCTVCGEMAGHPRYIPLLMAIGIRRLSVGPMAIPGAKKAIHGLTHDAATAALTVAYGGPFPPPPPDTTTATTTPSVSAS